MAKRGNQEGTIYRRQDGRWAAAVDLGWQGGQRKRKTLYGKTRREVHERLAEVLQTIRHGLPIPEDRLTVGNYLTQWLEDTAKATLRPRTYRSYEEIVRLHLAPPLGLISLSKLSPGDVQALLNSKLKTGLSPRRVQFIHAVLRRAVGQAEKWGLVSRNVVKLVDVPRVKRVKRIPYSPKEARVFIEAIRGDRLEALFYVALALGLRQGEALGLSWSDIDLEGQELEVRFALQKIDGEFRMVEPKSDTSRRPLALAAPVVAMLEAHRKRQIEERLQAIEWQDTGLVFTTPNGEPLSDGHVRKRFYNILSGAELRRQRFHDLRHACASLLLAQNVHPRVVMETLGHSTIALTMNTYSHVLPAAQREAADKMGDILEGTSSG